MAASPDGTVPGAVHPSPHTILLPSAPSGIPP